MLPLLPSAPSMTDSRTRRIGGVVPFSSSTSTGSWGGVVEEEKRLQQVHRASERLADIVTRVPSGFCEAHRVDQPSFHRTHRRLGHFHQVSQHYGALARQWSLRVFRTTTMPSLLMFPFFVRSPATARPGCRGFPGLPVSAQVAATGPLKF